MEDGQLWQHFPNNDTLIATVKKYVVSTGANF